MVVGDIVTGINYSTTIFSDDFKARIYKSSNYNRRSIYVEILEGSFCIQGHSKAANDKRKVGYKTSSMYATNFKLYKQKEQYSIY